MSVLKQFHHGLFPKRAINVNCHHFSNILIVWDKILFTLKIYFPTFVLVKKSIQLKGLDMFLSILYVPSQCLTNNNYMYVHTERMLSEDDVTLRVYKYGVNVSIQLASSKVSASIFLDLKQPLKLQVIQCLIK